MKYFTKSSERVSAFWPPAILVSLHSRVKRQRASFYKCMSNKNNYWITDVARKLPQQQNQAYNNYNNYNIYYCRCEAVGQTSWKDLSLFQTWFNVKCLDNMKWFTLEHFNTNAADEIS